MSALPSMIPLPQLHNILTEYIFNDLILAAHTYTSISNANIFKDSLMKHAVKGSCS